MKVLGQHYPPPLLALWLVVKGRVYESPGSTLPPPLALWLVVKGRVYESPGSTLLSPPLAFGWLSRDGFMKVLGPHYSPPLWPLAGCQGTGL